jgi:hypothetical protein
MVTIEGGFDGLHPVHLSTAIQKHHRPSNGLEQGPLKPEGYPHESNHQPLAPPFPHLAIKEACRLEARQPSVPVGRVEGLRFFAADPVGTSRGLPRDPH